MTIRFPILAALCVGVMQLPVAGLAVCGLYGFSDEQHFDFRARFDQVHEPGLRDSARVAAADEFAFADGCAVEDADFAINHPNMPADGVPYWDFGASGEERDSSAASIMASGLLELATFVEGDVGAAYRAFAVKQLLSLASSAYFSEGDEIGHFLLKHGTGHKPGGSEIDTPLDYGDYYFLEALTRITKQQQTKAREGNTKQ